MSDSKKTVKGVGVAFVGDLIVNKICVILRILILGTKRSPLAALNCFVIFFFVTMGSHVYASIEASLVDVGTAKTLSSRLAQTETTVTVDRPKVAALTSSFWHSEIYSELYQTPSDRRAQGFLRIQGVHPIERLENDLLKLGLELYRSGTDTPSRSRTTPVLTAEWHRPLMSALTAMVGGRMVFRETGEVRPKLRLGVYGGTFARSEDLLMFANKETSLFPFFETYYDAYYNSSLNNYSYGSGIGSESHSAGERYLSASLKLGLRFPFYAVVSQWQLDPVLIEGRLYQDMASNTGQQFVNIGPRLKWHRYFSSIEQGEAGRIDLSVFVARSFGFHSDAAQPWPTQTKPADPYWFLLSLGGAF